MTDRKASTLAQLDKAIEKSGFKLSHKFLESVRPVVRPKSTGKNKHDMSHEQVDEAVAEYLSKGGKITKVVSTPLSFKNEVNLDSSNQDDLGLEHEAISSSDYLENI